MNHRRPRAIALISGAAVVLCWACGGSGTPAPAAGPRRAMLQDLAVTVIVPTYAQLASEADGLATSAVALEAQPSPDTLAAVQQAWRRTRAVWKQSEAFSIGPAQSLDTASKIDWTPIRSQRIEDVIAGDGALSSAAVDDLGTNVKGFLAIEYLVFDPAGGDAAVLDQLADARRRGFGRALAENLRDQAVKLRDAWDPAAGNFTAQLVTAAQGSTVFPTVKSAVDAVVNQMIFVSEDVADAQLLAALGTRTGGTPRPDVLAASRSENGLADVLDSLAGVQNVYFAAYGGRQGRGLSQVVEDVAPASEGAIALSIRRAIETATRIPQPLETALTDDRDLVERAQVRAKELMQRLEIDLVSVLGTTLRFNPNDGD